MGFLGYYVWNRHKKHIARDLCPGDYDDDGMCGLTITSSGEETLKRVVGPMCWASHVLGQNVSDGEWLAW